jgi:hypothetical protein
MPKFLHFGIFVVKIFMGKKNNIAAFAGVFT